MAVTKVTTSKEKQTTEWVVDSGASMHLTMDENLLSSKEPTKWQHIAVASGEDMDVETSGSIPAATGGTDFMLEEVLLVPSLSHHLLSVPQSVAKGLTVTFNSKGCTISKDGKVLIKSGRSDGLFKVIFSH
jgi:hypothetical protein